MTTPKGRWYTSKERTLYEDKITLWNSYLIEINDKINVRDLKRPKLPRERRGGGQIDRSPSRSTRYKLASPCRSQWIARWCPPSCTPLARARTYGDWRTAATSHWWSWCRVAQSRCTAIFCICTVRRRTTGTRMGEKTVETNRRYEVEEGEGERERESETKIIISETNIDRKSVV